jgi:PAS domain S-box-containing protein
VAIASLNIHLQTSLTRILDHCKALKALPTLKETLLADIHKIGTAAQDLSRAYPALLERYQSTQTQTAKDADGPPTRPLLQDAERTLHALGLNDFQADRTSRILVVDDSATNRELVSRQLQRQGYEVLVATNGQEALQCLEDPPVDLILLDILMPEMNGYQVLMHLRQRHARQRIPVIMMSSLDEIDNVVQCIELGAEDYVAKPFNPVLLNRKISACLERDRLRQREVLYLAQSLIAETTPVPVLVTRLADGRILYANPKAGDSFGMPPESLLACCIQDFYHQPQDRQQWGEWLHQQGTIQGYELQCQRADGDLFWVTLSLQTLNFHGEPAALMALCDISDRKQAEEQLRQAEMKYRGIFENAVEGIYQATPEGQFFSVNQAMATLYGYDSPEGMIAALTADPQQPYVEPDCRDRISQQMQRCDRLQGVEYQIHRQEEGPRWLRENIQAVRDRAGHCLYYEGIVEDITERKREEAALKRQLKELQIEIDQNKLTRQVNEIVQSDYFRELEAELAILRAEEEDF